MDAIQQPQVETHSLIVPKGLVKKLSQVMGAVERVPKNGHNDFHGYDYSTEADIVGAVRMAMSERQLMMVPYVGQVTWADVPRKNGGTEKLCTVHVRFDLMDAESGESLSFPMIGQGTDGGDKGFYKALTGATKYALLKLFLIPTGDDPEDEGKAPGAPAPAAGRSKAPPAGGSSGHDRSLSFKFGNNKGQPLSELDDAAVTWYRAALARDLADPAKAKYAAKATLQLATLDAELRWRAAQQTKAPAPSPDIDETGAPVSERAKLEVRIREAQTVEEMGEIGALIKERLNDADRDGLRPLFAQHLARLPKAR